MPGATFSERRPKRARHKSSIDDFQETLTEAGCQQRGNTEERDYLIGDQFEFRNRMELKLGLDDELCQKFIDGLWEHLEDPEALLNALMPMNNCLQGVYSTGDSFLRVLMGVGVLKNNICFTLLERLAEYGSTDGENSVPRLILGQLRWLDHAGGSHDLVDKVFEVMPACSGEIQRSLVELLPEIVTSDDHERLVDFLENMIHEDSAFIMPAANAVAELGLSEKLQDKAIRMLLQYIQTVPLEDLPDIVLFFLHNASQGNVTKVIEEWRANLHFATPVDPRLPVHDHKGKAPVQLASSDSEAKLMECMKAALRGAPLVTDAILAILKNLPPSGLRVIDFWWLMLIHSLGGGHGTSAGRLLKRKLAGGRVSLCWFAESIVGHQNALWGIAPSLMAIAKLLCQDMEEPLQRSGAHLYKLLFCEFHRSYHRQEVLHALHGHIGSGEEKEITAGLTVLEGIATTHVSSLVQFSAYLANILDYIERFDEHQLRLVFRVFFLVITGAPPSGNSMGPSGVGRLGDQVSITIRKCLDSPGLMHRRVGIIGTVAMATCKLQTGSTACNSQENMDPDICEAWKAVEDLFETWKYRAPVHCLALLFEELAHALEDGLLLPKTALLSLQNTVEELFSSTFLMDLDWDTHDKGLPHEMSNVDLCGIGTFDSELWLNLDGSKSSICVKMCSMLASVDSQERSAVAWLCPALRLLSRLQICQEGNLDGIDGVLGCPLQMVPLEWAINVGCLACAQQELVVNCLFFGIAWLREVVAAFGPHSQGHSGITTDGAFDFGPKILSRLHQLQQLQAVLEDVLTTSPSLTKLPNMQGVLNGAQRVGAKSAGRKADVCGSKSTRLEGQTKSLLGQAMYRHFPWEVLHAIAKSDLTSNLPLSVPGCLYLILDVKSQIGCLIDKKGMKQGGRAWAQAALSEIGKCAASVRRLTDVAVHVAKRQKRNERGKNLEPNQANAANSAGLDVLSRLHSAEAATGLERCSLSVARTCINCISTLLRAGTAAAIEDPLALVDTLHGANSPASMSVRCSEQSRKSCGRSDIQKVVEEGHKAMDYLMELLQCFECELQVEVELLRAMKALVGALGQTSKQAGESTGPTAAQQMADKMRHDVFLATGAVLEHEGYDWKGHNSELSEIVRLRISHSDDPIQTIVDLLHTQLGRVGRPPSSPDKEVPYISLTTSTFGIWFRAIFEELVSSWEELCSELLVHYRSNTSSTRQIDNCLKRTAAFVAAFNALIQLAKAHATRVQVPAVTVKCSGRFVAEFIKTMPFWEHVYAAHQGEFVSLVKEMQKATKVVQALCSEAKSRKAMNLTTKVPAVKRVLERFIFVIKAFFHKVNRPEAFWMGNLKHKNLQGQQIASQIEAETRVEDSLSGSSTDASDTEDGNSEDSMPVHAASTRFQAGACDEEGMDEDTSDCI